MMHQKIQLIEIEPTKDEINAMLKLIDEYRNKVISSQIEKNNKLIKRKLGKRKIKDK